MSQSPAEQMHMTIAILSVSAWVPALLVLLLAGAIGGGVAAAALARSRTRYAPRVVLGVLGAPPALMFVLVAPFSSILAALVLVLGGAVVGGAAYYVRSLWVPRESGVGHQGDVYAARYGFRELRRELRDPAWRVEQSVETIDTLNTDDGRGAVLGPAMDPSWQPLPARVSLRIGQIQSGIVGLIIGKPESGKTTSAIRYLAGVIAANFSHTLLLVDPKGDRALEEAGRALASIHGVPFFKWDRDSPMDPLATNNDQPIPAVVERLMATQEWESDYWRNFTHAAWTDACELLSGAGQPLTLDGIVYALSPTGSSDLLKAMSLRVSTGEADGERYDELAREHNDRSNTRNGWEDRAGAGHRLRTIARSGLGAYLRSVDDGGFAIHELAAKPGVIYLPLRSAEWPDTSKAIAELLAVMLMQDLGPIADGGHLVTMFLDEVGAVPARRLDAILQRGRSSGFSVVLGMQTLSSIAADEPQLASQITGTLSWALVHQVTGQSEGGEDDAERMARLAGTRTQRELTIQTAGAMAMPTGAGTSRQIEAFSVNPNQLRGLPKGHGVAIDLAHPTHDPERVQRVGIQRYEATVKVTPVTRHQPALPPAS